MEIKKVVNPANKVMLERTSIRKYDPSVKISREEMTNILQDAMTAPSSLNLQPWHFVVIDTEQGKKLIKPYMMFNQLQWETSSAIIAIFADMQSQSAVEKIYSAAVDHKLMMPETKEKMVEMISSYAADYSQERLKESNILDCGFVIMQIMLAAKGYGYDTNPIGGFMKNEMAKTLGLDEKRYVPLLLLSIGKADEATHDSIRYSVSDVTEWR